MSRRKDLNLYLSRRTFLKKLGVAPLLFHPAPLQGFFGFLPVFNQPKQFPFVDFHLRPHYPSKSPLEDVLRLVTPGTDEYVNEKYAFEIDLILKQWSGALKASVKDLSGLAKFFDSSMEGFSSTSA